MRNAILAALALALVAACSGTKSAPHPRPSAPPTPLPTPSTFGPPDATLGSTGLVKVLPDTCQAVKPFMLPEMYDGHLYNSYIAGENEFEVCEWSSFSSTRAHILRYGYTKFASRDGALQVIDDRRRQTFSDDHHCRYDKSRLQDIIGWGASAFAVPCTVKKYQPDEGDHVYELRGLELDIVIRNLIVQLLWVGADYPAAMARKNPHWLHGGKGLGHSYDEALAFADRVAWNVLAHFP
jgi:hypothetical protein